MYKRILILIFFLAAANAQERVPLTTLWRMADSTNPDLEKLENLIAVQNADIHYRKSNFGPTLGINSAYQYQSEAFRITIPNLGRSFTIMRRNNFFNSVWLNWTLFEGMKRFYDIDNARSGKKELEERKIFVRETLKHQLTRLAQQSYLLDIQEKLLSKSRERILINLDKAKSLLREGQISSSDTLEFWQKILEVDKETGRIAETKKTIYREIGFLTGKDQMLRPEAGDLPPMADSGLYVPTARADMLALKAKGKGIEHQYSGLGSLYWPKVSIGAAWQYDKPGYDPISNNWVSYTKYNIGLQWIIWDWNKRKIAREKLQILAVNNTLEEKRLMDERKKELDKLRYKKSRLEEELTITQRQLELKNKYYRYRKEQYEMQQIDASQLSLTENELTSLELKIAAVKKEIETNKIDQIYVCGNFSRWIAEKE